LLSLFITRPRQTTVDSGAGCRRMQRDKVPGRQDKGRLRVVACAPGTHILPFPTSHPQKESTLFRANTFRVLENEHMSQDMGFRNGGNVGHTRPLASPANDLSFRALIIFLCLEIRFFFIIVTWMERNNLLLSAGRYVTRSTIFDTPT